MRLLVTLTSFAAVATSGSQGLPHTIALPAPSRSGDMSVEEALERRRSLREYAPRALTLAEVAQLLWAAQGVTEPLRGFRTAPSAGATFPLEVDVVLQGIEGVEDGVYRYLPAEHALRLRLPGDVRGAIANDALGQQSLREAAAIIAISSVTERTAARYGARAERYVHMEAGHAGQSVSLQAVALGLGTVMIGAFGDDALAETLRLEASERPLYLIPVGHPR
jgi:SagB-type dehydrogenase family enzyme